MNEFTGATGVDPRPFTLADLRAIAAASWDKTASIVATIAGLFDSSATVEKYNPYRSKVLKGSADPVKSLHRFKDTLPKWIPPE